MADASRLPPAQRTGSIDETLASLGAGVGEHDDLPLDRGDLIGRYVILEEIGRGAMGLVMAAYDPELDRKVALKLMPVRSTEADGGAQGSARLMREAQAMARLAHPNVITVHDVGTSDSDVFIAMEFVEGGSLRTWLSAEPRDWKTIVRLFLEAGEGLAAAHRQGIVHRDFKPDNVLVREDGRACVGDFGLARRDESAAPATPIEDMRSTLRNHPAELALGGLTLTGATMGTPAYMAPEQHMRTNVDHRSDQFAFCVALWEALAGERPYAGTTLGAIALNVTTGRRQPFPRDSPVPSRVRAALERGLAIDPAKRFANMDALLDVLRASLRRRRGTRGRVLAIASLAGGLGLLTAAVAYYSDVRNDRAETGSDAPALCSRAGEQLDGVWDPQIRDTAARAFADSGQPFASRSYTRIAETMDDLRDDWIASHTHACEATRVYGEQSEEMLDRRMSCLAQRRSELAAVGAALVAAGPDTITSADDLLLTISPIATCDDLPQLEAGLAAPPPEAREQVEQLRARLAELEILRRSASSTELIEETAALVSRAEAAGYDPVLAEALHLHAGLLEGARGPAEALPVARRAVTVATRAGHRRERARSLALVAWLEGTGRANTDMGLWLLDLADVESAALGRPTLLALQIESDRASILTIAGEFERGLEHFERALAFAERELGKDHMRAADLRFNIAATRHYLGQHDLAEQGFRAALEVYTELVGADHPEVAQCHNNLAAALSAQGKADEAEHHARRALAIWERSGGTSYLPGAYANLGSAMLARGDFERALQHFERAYAMKIEVFGPEHPTTLAGLGQIADVELELGRLDDARAHLDDALARMLAAAGPEHPDVFELRLSQVELAHLRGRHGEALRELEALQRDAEAAGPDVRHFVVAALVLRAEIEQDRGDVEAARAALDEAQAQFEAGVDPRLQASANQLRASLPDPP